MIWNEDERGRGILDCGGKVDFGKEEEEEEEEDI